MIGGLEGGVSGTSGGIGGDPTRDPVGESGVVETGDFSLLTQIWAKRKYYRGWLMSRGFFVFYFKITVGWLNLPIRCMWIFI